MDKEPKASIQEEEGNIFRRKRKAKKKKKNQSGSGLITVPGFRTKEER